MPTWTRGTSRPFMDTRLGSRVYDQLMRWSEDELASYYGLLAESVEVADDYGWVEYTLRENAYWHDGEPVTVDGRSVDLQDGKDGGGPQLATPLSTFRQHRADPVHGRSGFTSSRTRTSTGARTWSFSPPASRRSRDTTGRIGISPPQPSRRRRSATGPIDWSRWRPVTSSCSNVSKTIGAAISTSTSATTTSTASCIRTTSTGTSCSRR